MQEKKVYTPCKSDACPEAGTSLMQNRESDTPAEIKELKLWWGTWAWDFMLESSAPDQLQNSSSADGISKLPRKATAIYPAPKWNLCQGGGDKWQKIKGLSNCLAQKHQKQTFVLNYSNSSQPLIFNWIYMYWSVQCLVECEIKVANFVILLPVKSTFPYKSWIWGARPSLNRYRLEKKSKNTELLFCPLWF